MHGRNHHVAVRCDEDDGHSWDVYYRGRVVESRIRTRPEARRRCRELDAQLGIGAGGARAWLTARQREMLRAAYDAGARGRSFAGRGQYVTAWSLHRRGLVTVEQNHPLGPGRATITNEGRRLVRELDAKP